MGEGGGGREGDWECVGCGNRNYAFRSLCNRCKQHRILVDTKTPVDSKWFPRVGDWICTGCSNNNYASREKCKKCGQPKEKAAMPGASLPTYAHYFGRVQGLPGLKMNFGIAGNSALQHSLLLSSNWLFGGTDGYGLYSSPTGPLSGGSSGVGFSYVGNTSQVSRVLKGWHNGDWICHCSFHNYASRSQCQECNAPIPPGASTSAMNSALTDIFPTLGTKRLAPEEFFGEWDNKRVNAGDINLQFLPSRTNGQQHLFQGFEQLAGSSNDQRPGTYSKYADGNSVTVPSVHENRKTSQMAAMPALIGKGAKQWRDGDWMCAKCNNHNFASRTNCNRCKTQKEAAAEPVCVP
ncbi:uncharacterized protein [Elaeis guineensis]|uniref:uncharacterized protein isoform X1 n=1 Tax=Elaeis guineensis var. tenera TaxID=51953 RepID=UPI003C6D3FBC